MSGGIRRLLPLLIEAVPEPGQQLTPQHRLTRLSQVLLATGIGLLGAVTYFSTLSIGEATASRLQICPVLGQERGQVGDLEAFSLSTSGEAPNMLLWNYRLNRELIQELKPATRSQRLLLNQQIASLTIRMSRQCYLVRYYRTQAGALMTVSTGAAVLLVIVALVRIPKGLGQLTRTEQSILTTSLALLVFSIGYLTLGGQQKQTLLNWSYHKKGLQLFSLIRSSLATNQVLLPGQPSDPGVLEQPVPLNTSQDVGLLVARIDTWLLGIDQVAVGLNNSFARQTFDNLFQSDSQGQPTNPLGNAP